MNWVSSTSEKVSVSIEPILQRAIQPCSRQIIAAQRFLEGDFSSWRKTRRTAPKQAKEADRCVRYSCGISRLQKLYCVKLEYYRIYKNPLDTGSNIIQKFTHPRVNKTTKDRCITNETNHKCIDWRRLKVFNAKLVSLDYTLFKNLWCAGTKLDLHIDFVCVNLKKKSLQYLLR